MWGFGQGWSGGWISLWRDSKWLEGRQGNKLVWMQEGDKNRMRHASDD